MSLQIFEEVERPGVDVIRTLPTSSLFNNNWHQTSWGGTLAALLLMLIMGRSPSRDLGILEAKSKVGGGGKASLLKSWSHKASGEGAKYTPSSRHLKPNCAILVTFKRYLVLTRENLTDF